ncbi:deleted in malignant brain tumors 1 protein-like isoform X2 [Corticium candelabrum]|uniref:deleted in malignant brain tumors 1 protein-like isoform X2 n=1 Tax=Corticium candelabrum TaxID=121492 RepID=UPI002E26763D|nr:deleted in malignant brain tumors 1 protein-like isoform X2 [Corticium candelabrum]
MTSAVSLFCALTLCSQVHSLSPTSEIPITEVDTLPTASAPPSSNQTVIRLRDGTTEANGRVEVYINGRWGTVCDDKWDMLDAAVVCRQLGFATAVMAVSSGQYGSVDNDVPILMDNVACNGHEDTIQECTHVTESDANCAHSEDAGVVCYPSTNVTVNVTIRLRGGTFENAGRVEVFHGGMWGTVCDDGWDIADARVVCRQLGFPDAILSSTGSSFGEGNGSIWMDNVECSGDEARLEDCIFSGWGVNNCGHTEDAGVICRTMANDTLSNVTVRLVDGSSNTNGRIEIQRSGVYGTMCDDNWDINAATVVCRQLGFADALVPIGKAFFGQGRGPVWLDNVVCTGQETSIDKCKHSGWGVHNCGHSEDAGVFCSDVPVKDIIEPKLTIRLVGGNDSHSGRLEVWRRGIWGTVCNDNWDFLDAMVACRQLGFPSAQDTLDVSPGEGLIWMDDLTCTGKEQRLEDCRFAGWGSHNCRHEEDTGVTCEPNGRPTISSVKVEGPYSVSLQWIPPLLKSSVIYHYIIYYVETSQANRLDIVRPLVETPDNRTSIRLKNLKANTAYTFQIKAFIERWYGQYSRPLQATTEDDDTGSTIEVAIDYYNTTATSIFLSWKPLTNDRLMFSYYKIFLKADKKYIDKDGVSIKTEKLSTTRKVNANILLTNITDLVPNTKYLLQIRTVSTSNSKTSNPVLITTNAGAPNSVTPPLVPGGGKLGTALSPTYSFPVTLIKPSSRNGPISHYQVIVMRVRVTDGMPEGSPDDIQRDELVTYNETNNARAFTAYIATEFAADMWPENNRFYIGKDGQPNDRPQQYLNGPLNDNSFYTISLRVFADTRGICSNTRTNTTYKSSQWTHPVKTSQVIGTPQRKVSNNSWSPGEIVGIVIVCLVIIAIFITVIIFTYRKQKNKKQKETNASSTPSFNHQLVTAGQKHLEVSAMALQKLSNDDLANDLMITDCKMALPSAYEH